MQSILTELSLQEQQQLKNVQELEQELARLRQDGEAYRNDLKKQLDDAKQAGMQARHDAGQARAQATHEANLVQQLQDDKKQLSDYLHSWKRQGHEQQVGLSFPLHAVQAVHS